MGLIKSPVRSTRQNDSNLVKKSKTQKFEPISVKGGKDVVSTINTAVAVVEMKLSHYKDEYLLLRDEDSIRDYFEKIKNYGICAIDTETTSLDPLTTKIVGASVYIPGEKAAYIPINHISYITQVRSKEQVSTEFMKEILDSCKDVKWLMHNAPFDIRVIRNQIGSNLTCYWDTRLAAKCLDENESAALKDLHLKYCESEDTESLKYSTLFDGIPFDLVPVKTAYLYAAGDAIKTWQLYEFQLKHLNRRNLPGPYKVFTELEMPIIPVICDMEDTGITLDLEYCDYLKEKYHKMLDEKTIEFYDSLVPYDGKIAEYRIRMGNNCKLNDPIDIASPTQIAILLYDIMGLKSPDEGKPRGTGEDILLQLDTEVGRAILSYRGVQKLLTTYIDKMPEIVNPDGRIHCKFNQYGAATGRFSSQDPNLQNIPSHNKEIRKMFRAQDGYLLVGADFSQQEPRVLAFMSGDKNMQKAYDEGRDIYAWIAQFIYNVDYEECKEFRPDGTKNPEGKKRRDSVKSIILGIMYGRGAKAISDQIGCSVKEAQKIVDKFFDQFPMVNDFINATQSNAKKTGFVETVWGRKRRLPDMLLPEYEFELLNKSTPANFDPLSFDSVDEVPVFDVPKETKDKYYRLLMNAKYWKEKMNIKNQAQQEGIKVRDNTGIIAEASRQCVNSRIQGTSADITKYAMIHIGNDEILKDLGFQLLLQIHDEVIGECPKENARQCADRLCEIMISSAMDIVSVPMKCDAEITECWYGDEVEV